jgi:heat shock protein HslJ
MRRLAVPILLAALVGVLALPGAAHAQELPDTPDAVVIPPVVWVLTSFPGVGAIADPERYTVQFVPDGTINARADCNWKTGVWSGGNGALDVTITMSTVAGCPEDSLEDPFVQALDAATSYLVDGFTLILTGPTGEMSFSPALPAMA